MATQTIPVSERYESTAQVWLEILQTISKERVPRNPLVRWARWLRLHWKPVLLSLVFWTVYACAFVPWMMH